MNILFHFALAFGIALFLMAGAFALALKLKYFSLVDVVWAFTFGVIAISFGLFSSTFNQNWVFYALVLLWSLRLGAYILARTVSHFPVEDSRYVELRRKWADSLTSKFAAFFALQAATIVVLCVPLILIASNPHAQIDSLSKAAVLLWIVGVIGEAISDAQLRTFKMVPENAGQVCEVGFWSLCRHPNYFFEWIIWCAFGLYAMSAPYGLLSWVAPSLMFYLLNYVSGIPLAEAQAIKSKGDLYRDYQRRTNRFFPWKQHST